MGAAAYSTVWLAGDTAMLCSVAAGGGGLPSSPLPPPQAARSRHRKLIARRFMERSWCLWLDIIDILGVRGIPVL